MQKYWDSIVVGVITFAVVAIFLAVKPGYTPVTVSDEVLNPPVIEDVVEDTTDATEAEDVETTDNTAEAAATEEAATEEAATEEATTEEAATEEAAS